MASTSNADTAHEESEESMKTSNRPSVAQHFLFMIVLFILFIEVRVYLLILRQLLYELNEKTNYVNIVNGNKQEGKTTKIFFPLRKKLLLF